MTKVTKTVVVEFEDWIFLREQNVNISEEVRKFLSSLRGNISGADESDTTLELEKLKYLKMQKKAGKLHLEMTKTNKVIHSFENNILEIQEKELLKEKEIADQKVTCPSCDLPYNEKKQIKINDKLTVCHTCFSNDAWKQALDTSPKIIMPVDVKK